MNILRTWTLKAYQIKRTELAPIFHFACAISTTFWEVKIPKFHQMLKWRPQCTQNFQIMWSHYTNIVIPSRRTSLSIYAYEFVKNWSLEDHGKSRSCQNFKSSKPNKKYSSYKRTSDGRLRLFQKRWHEQIKHACQSLIAKCVLTSHF